MSFYTEENCSIFYKRKLYLSNLKKKNFYQQQIQKNISIVYGQIGTEF